MKILNREVVERYAPAILDAVSDIERGDVAVQMLLIVAEGLAASCGFNVELLVEHLRKSAALRNDPVAFSAAVRAQGGIPVSFADAGAIEVVDTDCDPRFVAPASEQN